MTIVELAVEALRTNIGRRVALTGKSARAISERAGLGPGAVADILSGRNKNPSVRSVAAIAAALGCDPVDLLQSAGIEDGAVPEDNVADAIRNLFSPLGGIELNLPSRRTHRKLPDFARKADDAA